MVLTESEFVSFYAYDTEYAPSKINNYLIKVSLLLNKERGWG
mgnify:CR=1 FL=1|jgi:hypothetical protein